MILSGKGFFQIAAIKHQGKTMVYIPDAKVIKKILCEILS